MDNQHRKISGYRELTQVEIDLMNEIKALGPQIQAVVEKVYEYVNLQELDVAEQSRHDDPDLSASAYVEWGRLGVAEPGRWIEFGEMQLKQGLMALTRAVAQPSFF